MSDQDYSETGNPDLTLETYIVLDKTFKWEILEDDFLSNHRFIRLKLNCDTNDVHNYMLKTRFGHRKQVYNFGLACKVLWIL